MKQLKTMLSGQSRLVAVLVFAGFLNAACVLLLARGYATLLNAALAGETGNIARTALTLALVAVANAALSVGEYALYGSIAENAGHKLRMKTADNLLKAECCALQSRHTADGLSRVNNELKQATDWLRNQFCPTVIDASVLLCVFTAMMLTNWKLTLAAYAVVPLITFYAFKASKPIRQATGEQQAALGRSNVLVKSVLDAFPIVSIFDMKAMMAARYGKAVDETTGLAVKANSIERLLMSVNGFSTLIPMGILLGAGGAMVIGGGMTAGALLAYLNLSNFIVNPLMNLPNKMSAARSFSANLDRITELNGDPAEGQRPMNSRLADAENGSAIELRNVHFGYEEDRPVLRNVSLTVPRGSRVALVGPSGCGKSTIIKLLAALYMPQQGCVTVLGRDTSKWNLAALRSQIAVVMQDAFLFPGSMRENITCGHDMPEEKLMDACRAAGLSELIRSLPDGLESDVGERGAKLSGGQKQRVAIARAIAKDAPVLLLDEATSALDGQTEKDIQEALETLMRGRTTLIITHRLSSIRDADSIYYMDGGRIVEQGTHGELMALDGCYAGLVRVQGGTDFEQRRGDKC